MSRTAPAVVTMCLLAVASLGGCGDRDGEPRATAPSPTAPATSPVSTPSPSPARPAREYTKADLEAALLTRRDLPAGYRVDTQLAVEDLASVAFSQCPSEYSAKAGYLEGARATTGRVWSTTTGRFIVQSLTLLPSGLDNNLYPFRTALASCTSWVVEHRTHKLTMANYGPYGDESLSFAITVTEREMNFTNAVIYVRTANIFMALRITVVGYRAPADAKAIFDQAVHKLPRP